RGPRVWQSSCTKRPCATVRSRRLPHRMIGGTGTRRTWTTGNTKAAQRRPPRPLAGTWRRSSMSSCQPWRVDIMYGATVSVAVVTGRTEAELIVGMLRSHGLRAASAPDDAGGREPQLQLQGVRVLVARSDEAAARRLLTETDGTGDGR